MKSHFVLMTEAGAYGFPFSSVLYYRKVIQDSYPGGNFVEIGFANGVSLRLSLQYGEVFIDQYIEYLKTLNGPN